MPRPPSVVYTQRATHASPLRKMAEPLDIPSVRILPMSNRIEGFRDRSIEDVQQKLFLGRLRKTGKFHYTSTGLNAPPGAIILFQFSAHVIASAVFRFDERFEEPKDGLAGALHLEPESIQVFDPVDAETMRACWPQFTRFGHVKQHLNPGRYEAFRRKLRNVRP